MITVKKEPGRIVPGIDKSKRTDFEGHAFFEASSIRKINDTYYFIYSSQVNHELCYATSKYPDRGFRYGGVIISNGDIGYKGRKAKRRVAATGNNHGSIERINGEWYVFYHRHTHLNSYNRQGCAEKIKIETDGSIRQVGITSCGLNQGALLPKGEYPATIACVITDGHMPHIGNGVTIGKHPMVTHGEEKRYITGIRNDTIIGFRYFAFHGPVKLKLWIRGKGNGRFIISDGKKKERQEIAIKVENAIEKDWVMIEHIVNIEETAPLYLQYKGKGMLEFLKLELEEL